MLVEDAILIRMGLITVSQLHPDIELVGEVEEGEEAVACYRKCKPDIVLVDMRLPGINGAQVIQELRKEFGAVVALVLSSYASDDDVYRAVQAGAVGYLLKEMPLAVLIEAIRAVHAGEQYFPPRHFRAAGRTIAARAFDGARIDRAQGHRQRNEQQGNWQRPQHHRSHGEGPHHKHPRKAASRRSHPGRYYGHQARFDSGRIAFAASRRPLRLKS